jgi:AcrR family transcriptional regulator
MIQQPWIEKGYQVFAYQGPVGLKIERLAKGIGKNKSSFYHHFADLEIFTGILLKYHLEQAQIMAEKESKCASLEELIEIILEHKIDLLFNRQLRIHRENADFANCFEKTNQITSREIIPIWSEILNLQENSFLAGLVLKLSLENFFLQITDETLNHKWLNNYFQELQSLIRAFKKDGTISVLDGSV